MIEVTELRFSDAFHNDVRRVGLVGSPEWPLPLTSGIGSGDFQSKYLQLLPGSTTF